MHIATIVRVYDYTRFVRSSQIQKVGTYEKVKLVERRLKVYPYVKCVHLKTHFEDKKDEEDILGVKQELS